MRAIIGVISRVTVVTGVAFLAATGVAAAHSALSRGTWRRCGHREGRRLPIPFIQL